MCSGRVDLEHLLRAFFNGQDGVFIGGCRLGECNYITHGNFDALSNVYICKKILEYIGLNPARLRIEFMSGADGNLLAEVTDAFTEEIQNLGPLGETEGLDKETLKFRLNAAQKLVPYLKLVERERLRAPSKTEEAYRGFFESPETGKLLEKILSEKFALSQILSLLGERPLSTGEISEKLGLNPSEVSRYMNRSSRHGWVRYDVEKNCYGLA